MKLPDYLTLPRIMAEEDPTDVDLRQILRWSLAIPRLAYTATVGTQPPANLEPVMIVGSFVGAPAAGVLNIALTGFSYGYIPIVCAGDSPSIGSVTVQLSGSTKTNLQVLCYTPSGSLVSGTNVRVNYQLIGA